MQRHNGVSTPSEVKFYISRARELLVKQTDGEEAIFHIDLSTQMSGHIGPGSRIEAKVNEVDGEKYALSISLAR
jgi:predicted thioesterase